MPVLGHYPRPERQCHLDASPVEQDSWGGMVGRPPEKENFELNSQSDK